MQSDFSARSLEAATDDQLTKCYPQAIANGFAVYTRQIQFQCVAVL